jgi:hypothetical protein
MPRKSYRPEEVIAKLREADVLLGQGKKVGEVVKALGVSEVSYSGTSCSTGRSSTAYAVEPRSGSTRSWSRPGGDTTTRSARTRPWATGRRHPKPSRGRGRPGRRYDRPLATAPMSSITNATPGPNRWGRSL